MTNGPAEVSGLLKAWGEGDQAALDRLTPMVYQELHRMARRYMRNERVENSLQATALVNEAYLRLVGIEAGDWESRVHFFAVSAQIMRRILVDRARMRAAVKRGGEVQAAQHSSPVNLDELPDLGSRRSAQLIAVDDALNGLTVLDPRKARVVELRFFGGLSVEETAQVLKISPQSVMRDWRLAKSWLRREFSRRG
jgi:RNA polymerase sigma factor (TIGR02999 family)